MSETNARIVDLKMELRIDAPPAKVWQSLTENIGAWWPAEFYAGGTAGKRDFALEARPGGRMFESWEEGGGVLWATVATVDPLKMLQVVGNLFPNWGGPSQWYGTWELKADGDGTILTFSESSMGKVSDSGKGEKEQGWNFLWSQLKANAEGKPAPAWPA